jgi:RNA-directed DNA polymerase
MKIPTTEQEAAELSMREAVLPPRVQRLRQKLSRKAKEQKRFRFYSLYDKIIEKETLTAAYRQVRANDGAPGVDGVTLTRIDEVIGEERFVRNSTTNSRQGSTKPRQYGENTYRRPTGNCDHWEYR